MASYKQEAWSLDGLVPGLAEAFKELALRTDELEALRGELRPDLAGEDFRRILQALERFSEAGHRLQAYAHLRFAADTRDHEVLAIMVSVDRACTEAQNRVLFLDLWWKGLDDESAGRLMAEVGDLSYYLSVERLFKGHTLSEPEEKVINIKDVHGVAALTKIYEMITNKLLFTIEVEGESRTLTRDALMALVRHPSADVREAVYREQFRVFGEEATVLGQIYVYRVLDWAGENVGLRKFPSPIAVRNLSNDVADEVVDTLLRVCVENAPVFHEYFRYKAGLLGAEGGTLRRFDLYAPPPGKAERPIPYADGVGMVLEGFDRFAPEMGLAARRILDARRVDAEVRHGKRGGAFCMSVTPAMVPWVLMNYTGTPREVATLAHEFGHGIHSLLAADHSIMTFHPALPMAETASVFSEMLLTDLLLHRESDPLGRRDLLMGVIDDIYATVLRQAFFVLFEREAHQAVVEGASVEDLHAFYARNLAVQFGDAVDIDDCFRYEWVSIPHIFNTPFYCYAYSFGQLLSLALYQRYREIGPSFAPQLFKILAYGGSAKPAHILGEAGIDIGDEEFWRGGFRFIQSLVDDLKGMG